jgi:hypothetical protein
VPTTDPAVPVPPLPRPTAERLARRSQLHSERRRAAAARGRSRRRRARTGAAAVLGAMTLAAGAAAAQDPVGGAQPSSPAAAATTVLQQGSAGAAVRQLQRKLRLRADGHFGPQTARALKRWQRRHGVEADGVAGPATLKALGVRARTAEAPAAGASPALERIARCESGGDPTAVSANGRYFGKYQFSVETWRAIGGQGSPASASEAEQDRLAAALYAAQGAAPWPNCGV